MVVVNVDYSKAPENKFPSSHEDAYFSLEWVFENIKRYGGDAKQIAVGGFSFSFSTFFFN